MADHTAEMVEIRGCKVEVLRGGAGPALLFLHGAGGANIWAPYMDALAESFDLIVPSHPGFGNSDTPDWLDNMSDLAYFYLDFMAALDLDGVHPAGNFTEQFDWLRRRLSRCRLRRPIDSCD